MPSRVADGRVTAGIVRGKKRPVQIHIYRRGCVLKLSLRQAGELRAALESLGRFVDADPPETGQP